MQIESKAFNPKALLADHDVDMKSCESNAPLSSLPTISQMRDVDMKSYDSNALVSSMPSSSQTRIGAPKSAKQELLGDRPCTGNTVTQCPCLHGNSSTSTPIDATFVACDKFQTEAKTDS